MNKTYKIQEILAGCRKKQAKYQRALVDTYAGYLHATCKRYLKDDASAKDMVQDSLMKIFENLEKYDADKGHFKAWITTITIRLCLTKLNKKNLLVLDLDERLESSFVTSEGQLILDKMQTEYLLEMIKELPDGYRVVFNMAAIDGFSHTEIASHLNITELTSRTRLSRARRTLRHRINNLNKQELWINSI